MFKNVASQKFSLFMFDVTTGLGKTGDSANITGYVAKDGGTLTALTTATATEISSTNAPGWYLFSLAQAETNADMLLLSAKSTTSNVACAGNVVYTTPANFTSMVITTAGGVGLNTSLKQAAALAKYPFLMTDSTTHNPVTGKTVTATRSIDGGAFAAGTLSAVTEVANGIYTVDLATGDMNGRCITLRLTGSGCDDLFLTLITEP